jgi:hypothetical protein
MRKRIKRRTEVSPAIVKKTDRSQSRDSSRYSCRSSNGRSLSNRKEMRKTWSDSDFENKRGLACSRNYDPKREKRCLTL